jgi:RNA polymerase sigma factor (sigma-70 family)
MIFIRDALIFSLHFRLAMSIQSRLDGVCPLVQAVVSARLHSGVRLKCRAHLPCRRSTRVSQATSKWFRANQLHSSDGSFGQTPRTRAVETWQLQRCVTMSRLSARYAQLIRMCRKRGCSREDANDLVQEAHLRLFDYERSTKVRDVESLLRRIVINLSITHYHRELAAPFTFESVVKLDKQGILIDPAPGPERTMAAELELDSVVNALTAASPRTCQIFIAQRAGYSYGEIAAAFAVKPTTIDKHVAIATLILKEMAPAGSASP